MNKISKGEKLISNILKQSKIIFEKEKTFIDLKRGKLRLQGWGKTVNKSKKFPVLFASQLFLPSTLPRS